MAYEHPIFGECAVVVFFFFVIGDTSLLFAAPPAPQQIGRVVAAPPALSECLNLAAADIDLVWQPPSCLRALPATVHTRCQHRLQRFLFVDLMSNSMRVCIDMSLLYDSSDEE
jgi:hypothetical protein